MRGIHRWPVNSRRKEPVTRKMFPFDDVIMQCSLFTQPTWSLKAVKRIRQSIVYSKLFFRKTTKKSSNVRITGPLWGESTSNRSAKGHITMTTQWARCVWNHQPQDCLLYCLFRCWSKKTSKLHALAFVRGINRWPVNFRHKWPVTQKMFLFDDVIMFLHAMTSSWHTFLRHKYH